MKKSLYAILVILLSFIGANTWASKFDNNVHSGIMLTSDTSANQNSTGEGGGGRNSHTISK